MKDALGKEIQIGDIVVKGSFGQYATIQFAKVDGFTPKCVRLKWVNERGELQKAHSWEKDTFVSYPGALLVITSMFNERLENSQK